MKRSLLAAVTVSSIVACSLTTDLSGFVTGDDPDAAAADGATSPDGGGAEASAGDATAGTDSGVVPCTSRSPQPFFCTDFDDATSISDLFDNNSATTLGDGVRDSLAKSGTSSLLLRQTKTFTGNCGYLEYWRDVGGPNEVVLETWVRLGDAAGNYPANGPFASISHRSTSGTNGCNQIFRTIPGVTRLQSQTVLADGSTDDDNVMFSRPIIPGQWTLFRVVLSSDPGTGGTRIVVTLDGQSVLDSVRVGCQLGTASVRVGMYCESRTTREMRFDNLLIDAR